jgi:hypothetical protein
MYKLELTFTCRDQVLANRLMITKIKKKDLEKVLALHVEELENLLKSRAVWDSKGFLQELEV